MVGFAMNDVANLSKPARKTVTEPPLLAGLRFFLGSALILFSNAVYANCQAAFPAGQTLIMNGSTVPGIKNDFAEKIQISLDVLPPEDGQVLFSGGVVRADQLPGGELTWLDGENSRWGNHCLDLPIEKQEAQKSLLILSWDPLYRHPNLHGLIEQHEDNWLFRGFLDNAAQEFHEAAVELRWSGAR